MTMEEPVWRYAARAPTAPPVRSADDFEAQRAAKFRDPVHAQDFLHARALMRELLAEKAGIDADTVRLSAFDDARPVAQGFENMGISWSRSGAHAVAAVFDDGVVGVDLERVREIETGPILDMVAAQEERDIVQRLGEDEAALRGFYRLWCAKEAVLKWRGTGLRGGAKSATIPSAIITGKATESLMEDSGAKLRLKALPLGRACIGYMAFSG